MLEELLATKFAEIESKAQGEKNGARFVVNLVEDNYDRLVKLYHLEGLSPLKLRHAQLYHKVDSDLRILTIEMTCKSTDILHYLTQDQLHCNPFVEMVWARIVPLHPLDLSLDKEQVRYIRRPTDEGIKLIDGFRQAMQNPHFYS